MLQKIKPFLPLLLAALFLYPLVYQSVHIFEHSHDSDCCGYCHGHQQEYPVGNDHATSEYVTDQEGEDCPICNFHYAKLQLTPSRAVESNGANYIIKTSRVNPKPFIFFQGYLFSLRAPPLNQFPTPALL